MKNSGPAYIISDVSDQNNKCFTVSIFDDYDIWHYPTMERAVVMRDYLNKVLSHIVWQAKMSNHLASALKDCHKFYSTKLSRKILYNYVNEKKSFLPIRKVKS
jgi:hypothetical protein